MPIRDRHGHTSEGVTHGWMKLIHLAPNRDNAFERPVFIPPSRDYPKGRTLAVQRSFIIAIEGSHADAEPWSESEAKLLRPTLAECEAIDEWKVVKMKDLRSFVGGIDHVMEDAETCMYCDSSGWIECPLCDGGRKVPTGDPAGKCPVCDGYNGCYCSRCTGQSVDVEPVDVFGRLLNAPLLRVALLRTAGVECMWANSADKTKASWMRSSPRFQGPRWWCAFMPLREGVTKVFPARSFNEYMEGKTDGGA